MSTKKVKLKVKKKKLKIKKILIFLIFLIILTLFVTYFLKMPIKNIYINGNNYVSDREIIKLAKLEKYPSFIKTYFNNIEEKIKRNIYIKNIKVKRKMFGKIYIEVEEYKPLAIYREKIILSSSKQIDNNNTINHIPTIINNIDNIYNKFVESFTNVDENVLVKISHIEYAPNEVDKERFILYMVDSNYVYITLSKIEKINKYNSIVNELEEKKAIIYLDSGDYAEIKS